jgi:hypothetical protein
MEYVTVRVNTKDKGYIDDDDRIQGCEKAGAFLIAKDLLVAAIVTGHVLLVDGGGPSNEWAERGLLGP